MVNEAGGRTTKDIKRKWESYQSMSLQSNKCNAAHWEGKDKIATRSTENYEKTAAVVLPLHNYFDGK